MQERKEAYFQFFSNPLKLYINKETGQIEYLVSQYLKFLMEEKALPRSFSKQVSEGV
jgi:hypothetical protein